MDKEKEIVYLEENGNITFLHKVKEGSIDKSYGIHVAKLANLPNTLIVSLLKSISFSVKVP